MGWGDSRRWNDVGDPSLSQNNYSYKLELVRGLSTILHSPTDLKDPTHPHTPPHTPPLTLTPLRRPARFPSTLVSKFSHADHVNASHAPRAISHLHMRALRDPP